MLDAGFAVGSIVGVWPGRTLLGVRGREQAAACYAVYGPRTLLVLAAPQLPGGVNEYALLPGDDAAGGATAARWRRLRAGLRVAPDAPRVFAPAHARAVADNAPYRQLLHALLDQRLTIRYRRVEALPRQHSAQGCSAPQQRITLLSCSRVAPLRNSGAMVPDVHHMLSKGGGLFLSPGSAAAPPKLRLLFEACPMAFVVEAAGGASSDAEARSRCWCAIRCMQAES